MSKFDEKIKQIITELDLTGRIEHHGSSILFTITKVYKKRYTAPNFIDSGYYFELKYHFRGSFDAVKQLSYDHELTYNWRDNSLSYNVDNLNRLESMIIEILKIDELFIFS